MKGAALSIAGLFLISACRHGESRGGSGYPAGRESIVRTSSRADTSSQGCDLGCIVGTWESTSCGQRKYARSITFLDDGGFTMTDLVAPCPAGAKCVWSGIVHYGGTWHLKGERVVLSYGEPVEQVTAYTLSQKMLPKEFFVSAGEGGVFLLSSAGDESGCRYQRHRV